MQSATTQEQAHAALHLIYARTGTRGRAIAAVKLTATRAI